jgi:opacity protein-like surface antigen
MRHRIAIILAALLTVPAAASAQQVEASVNVGYSASDGFTTSPRPLLGVTYDEIKAASGPTLGFTFGVFFSDRSEFEFVFNRQTSELRAGGPGTVDTPVADLTIYNYHGNFVYNWGERDGMIRPYIFGGLGATQYTFGQMLVPTPAGSTESIPGETRFSTNWGGGVKAYFTPSVGARLGVRWTPTYIKSDPAGMWCDPFYGCWQAVNTQYANQFDMTVGLTVRFDD